MTSLLGGGGEGTLRGESGACSQLVRMLSMMGTIYYQYLMNIVIFKCMGTGDSQCDEAS